MKQTVITLETNDSKIYKQILAFLGFMLDITPQEREVLADLIKLNHEYEALPEEKRAKFILSTDMRKEIREALEIEEKQFNGIIGRLKKKDYMESPILDENNVINPQLLFKPDEDGFEIKISLLNATEKKVEQKTKQKQVVEEVSEEAVETTEPVGERALASPANGTDNIIHNEFDATDFQIS